jgi:SET family sugar efflux transporter-like MFS transporter
MNHLITRLKTDMAEARGIPAYLPALACTFLMGVGFSLTMTFMPLFGIQQMGMSSLMLGIFLTVSSMFEVGICSWLGKLSDTRVDRKIILLSASIAAVLGYILFAFLDNYYALLLVSITFIALATAVFPQIFAYVRDAATAVNKDASIAISVQRTLFSFSWVVGPLLAPLLIREKNYSLLFLFVALLYAVIAVITVVYLKSYGRPAATNEAIGQDMTKPSRMSKPVGRWLLWISIAAFMVFETSNAMSGIALPLLTTVDLQATDRTVGLIVGLNALLQIPLMLGFGLLAKRYGNAFMMKSAGWFGILYFVLSAFAESTWQLAACQVLNAAYVSIVLGVGLNYCQDLMPDSPGAATTLYSNATTIGVMLGGFMAGSIGEWIGNRAIFIACAILAGLGLLLINGTSLFRSKAPVHTAESVS